VAQSEMAQTKDKLHVAQTAHGATRMAQTEVAQTVVAQLGSLH